MAVVTVTRLRARDAGAGDEVVALTGEVLARLETTPGFLGGRLLLEGGSAWTLTVFRDVAALRAFAHDHAPVAGQGPRLADVLQSTAWRTAARTSRAGPRRRCAGRTAGRRASRTASGATSPRPGWPPPPERSGHPPERRGRPPR